MNHTECLPFHVEHIALSDTNHFFQSHFDNIFDNFDHFHNTSIEIPFESIVVSNVNWTASSSELWAAAVQHIIEKCEGYLLYPHQANPTRDICNLQLFPMLYLTLFPFGIGGLQDLDRKVPISFKAHVCYLLNL